MEESRTHREKGRPDAQFEIHVSDVRTYKSCRRRWDWSSPLRGNLEPNFTPPHFFIGRAVHYAAASFLENGTLPTEACAEPTRVSALQ